MERPVIKLPYFLILSFVVHGLAAYFILFTLPIHREDTPVEISYGFDVNKKAGLPSSDLTPESPKKATKKHTVPKLHDRPHSPEAKSVKSSPGTSSGHEASSSKSHQGSDGQGGGVDTPLSRYIQSIVNLIEKNKQYPKRARTLGQEGTVVLKIDIDHTGAVTMIKVTESPPFELLISAAKEIIKKISKFPPIPAEVNLKTLSLSLPIHFKLED